LESLAYSQKLWDGSAIANRTLVEVYLRGRGLVGEIPDSIRFLSNHLHKPSETRWPVMIARVVDTAGTFQAIHRTYLTHDGKSKAPVTSAKMTLGAVGGYAVHLAHAGEKLAISEGIETGLSVQQATGIPTWAAISAGGMRQLILPPLPLASEIVIAADADPVGIKSAHDAANRFQKDGRIVRVAIPPNGLDFNDVLQGAAI
jgi:phage/plasmid primase-like uncharacterized protein